jgi:hypothetical protein
MEKVNAALNQLGEDSLSGMKLLQEVIKSPDCPLEIRIQCSGLLQASLGVAYHRGLRLQVDHGPTLFDKNQRRRNVVRLMFARVF